MAFGNWDEIVQTYKDTYLDSKYSYHAKAMIELIPSIRSLPEFDGIMPGTSHGTLFFSVDDKAEIVSVLYSEDGIYTIYLEHPSEGEINKLTATSEDVVSVLETSIRQLKSLDDNA